MGKKKRTTSNKRASSIGQEIPFLAAQQREMSKNEVKHLINQIGLICNQNSHQKNQKSLRKHVPKVQSGSSTRRQSASRDTSLIEARQRKIPQLPINEIEEEEKKEEKPYLNEDLALMTERGRILGQQSQTHASIKQEPTLETQQTMQAF